MMTSSNGMSRYLAAVCVSHLVSESKSTIELELFPSMSLFPSCAARVIGPFKSETFQPRLSCLQFGAIDICTILLHSLNIQIQILISTYFQHRARAMIDIMRENTVKLKSNSPSDFNARHDNFPRHRA